MNTLLYHPQTNVAQCHGRVSKACFSLVSTDCRNSLWALVRLPYSGILLIGMLLTGASRFTSIILELMSLVPAVVPTERNLFIVVFDHILKNCPPLKP